VVLVQYAKSYSNNSNNGGYGRGNKGVCVVLYVAVHGLHNARPLQERHNVITAAAVTVSVCLPQ